MVHAFQRLFTCKNAVEQVATLSESTPLLRKMSTAVMRKELDVEAALPRHDEELVGVAAPVSGHAAHIVTDYPEVKPKLIFQANG